MALCGPLAAEMVPARAIVALPDVRSATSGGKPLRILFTRSASQTPAIILTPPEYIADVEAALPQLPIELRPEVWGYGYDPAISISTFGAYGRIGTRQLASTFTPAGLTPDPVFEYDIVLPPIAFRFAGHSAVRVFTYKAGPRFDFVTRDGRSFTLFREFLDVIGNSGLTEYHILDPVKPVRVRVKPYRIRAASYSLQGPPGATLARAIVESQRHTEVVFELEAAPAQRAPTPKTVTFTSASGRTDTRDVVASSWHSPHPVSDVSGMGPNLYRLIDEFPITKATASRSCPGVPTAPAGHAWIQLESPLAPCPRETCRLDLLARQVPVGEPVDLDRPPGQIPLYRQGSATCIGPIEAKQKSDIMFFSPTQSWTFSIRVRPLSNIQPN